MSLLIIGVDPGLARSGLCVYDVGRREAVRLMDVSRDTLPAMVTAVYDAVQALVSEYEIAAPVIALEDFTWRAPKAVGHRQITTGLEMCRLLGRLQERLDAAGCLVYLVRPQDSKRDQPEGRLAKKLGIPGANKDQRSAFYAAQWLAGTMRLAGGRR